SIPLSIACVLPIGWRRVRPIQVAVGVTAAQVLFTGLDFSGPNFIGVLVALYSVGAHAAGRSRRNALVLISVMIGLLFIAGLFVDELIIADFIWSTVILVTAFVLGDNLRRRREAAVAMTERAERAERERDLLAQQRVAAERSRIARELHDVVAHSVSAMVIQATAARRSLHHAPEQAEDALGNIETVGRRAMAELRTTLDVLRASSTVPTRRVGDADETDIAGTAAGRSGIAPTGDAPVTSPQPTLDDVMTLVDEATDLPITALVPTDLGEVPAAVALAGFRIIQEALTNVRRHGGDVDEVLVSIERRGDVIHVEVLDDGRGAAADATPEPGYGIRGMHERVAAIGGFVVAEHRIGGGWQVYAELPARSTDRHPVRTSTVPT
ncbi:MAG: sensor histidine kinase, partial [Actinomycetota bacterium]